MKTLFLLLLMSGSLFSADVLNRDSKVFLKSVHTPDYPVKQWIVNPDLSAVQGYAVKYWKIKGDIVLPMTVEEIQLQDAITAQAGLTKQAASALKESYYQSAMAKLKALNLTQDELNALGF